jgi:hypothetical protein
MSWERVDALERGELPARPANGDGASDDEDPHDEDGAEPRRRSTRRRPTRGQEGQA